MARVREGVEDVAGVDGLIGTRVLLIAEDEVYPVVQVLRHIIGFEGLALLPHERLWSGGPRRQHYVADDDAVLLDAEIVAVRVAEELRHVEELRDQLLYLVDLCVDMCGHVCRHMNRHVYRYVQTCMGICADMCIRNTLVNGHVYTHVHGHVCKDVYRHVEELAERLL